jgi:type I restriction enzyme R subunit
LKKAAILTLMAAPPLRKLILDLRQKFEQIVDEVSKDTLLADQTGYSPEAKEKAETLVKSFESYLAEHKNEIEALQFFYSVPHKVRLRFKDIQALANAISSPPRSWTAEKLWRAYETLEKSKVRGASAQRLLTDIVSLVRFALHQDGELVPHADRVHERYQTWLAQQANKGRRFSNEQMQWLGMMRDHIATSLEVDMDSFDLTPFTNEGGLARASKVFGKDLSCIVQELNEALAA